MNTAVLIVACFSAGVLAGAAITSWLFVADIRACLNSTKELLERGRP